MVDAFVARGNKSMAELNIEVVTPRRINKNCGATVAEGTTLRQAALLSGLDNEFPEAGFGSGQAWHL